MQAKIGDKVKVLVDTYGNQYTDTQYYFGPKKGDIIDVVEKCRSNGYWIDSTSVDVKAVNDVIRKYMYEFEVIPTAKDFTQKKFSVEDVKSKFSKGEKVIVTKNTPDVQEGWVGFVVKYNNASVYPYQVSVDGKPGDHAFAFLEVELESLKGISTSTPFSPTDDTVTPNRIEEGFKSALDKQVSGSHYKDFKIQPAEYCHANNIPFLEGNVIKYTSRHRAKNGKKDLEKAIHCLELLIELEYKE